MISTTDIDLLESLARDDPPECGKQDWLDLYRKSADTDFASHLFAAARKVRDRHIGAHPWWSAGASSITPCELEELCTYCTFFTRRPTPTQHLVDAARTISGLGFRYMHLSGGTRLPTSDKGGYDAHMINLIRAILAEVDINIEVNLGPSFTREGVHTLKALGVSGICCSLEVLNADIFKRLKPADTLSGRIELMEYCEDEGVPLRSMMLVGLGETDEDRIEHVLFLRRFKALTHLRLSRYVPFRGGIRCSPWPVARLTAIARLIHRDIDLGMAAGNTPDDFPLWWHAGGGNQLLGAKVSMKETRDKSDKSDESRTIAVNERLFIHDSTARIGRYLRELGLQPGFAPPEHKFPRGAY